MDKIKKGVRVIFSQIARPTIVGNPAPMKGKISEIFRSMQGEGIYAGMIEQIFIRFSGCNLKCSFCDTPNKRFREYTAESVLKKVKNLSKSENIHSISITGGEPLLQINFLEHLCNMLKKNKFKTYLETNGVMYNNLKRIIKSVDYVSMDFKLPSSTGLITFWQEHLEFLKIASKKEVFVKAVITSNTELDEIRKSSEIIASVDKSIPLILQPVTAVNPSCNLPSSSQTFKFLKVSKEFLTDVRVIPQLHKIIGIE